LFEDKGRSSFLIYIDNTDILNMLDAEAKFLASSNARTARNVERAREAEEERQKNR
jgi:hypothetical protein